MLTKQELIELRKGGVSDDEILSGYREFNQSHNSDIDGLLKGGVKSSDILDGLTEFKPATKEEARPETWGDTATNFRKAAQYGVAGVASGLGKTLEAAGATNVGPVLETVGKKIAPADYAPASSKFRFSDFSTYSYIPRALVEGAPGEWGAFLRREPSLGLGWSPPPVGSNFSRTIVCHVKPKLDDLTRILSHGPVSVINAKALRAKAPWAHGMSADKRLCLPSHVLAPMISWKAHDAGVEMPTVTRRDLLAAGSPEEAQRALYGAVWDRAREVSLEGFRATLEPVPQPLQAVWKHQRDGHHCYGLDIVGMPPCDPEDLRRHALHAGMKAADGERVPRPLAVTTTKVTTTDPVGTLIAQAQWGKLLASHNAAAELIFGTDEAAGLVAHLDGTWDSFVGADFSGR